MVPSQAPVGTGALALVMIARDEARCIERCLRSAAPYVDRMLVLDTGSQDHTMDIARACGAQVHEMVWPQSFALARNHALELADADWSLVLDADEWIAQGGDALREALPGLHGPGVLRVDSHSTTAAGEAVSSDWITRLLPRGVRYEGLVHEQAVTCLPRCRLPVVIGHDGYDDTFLQGKRGRNRMLLEAALRQQGGQDAYLLYQLGKDCETYGELVTAAEHYGQALAQADAFAGYRRQLVVRAMHCLGKSGQLEAALALAADHLEALGGSVNYQFTLGDLCLDAALAFPQDAASQWLPLARAAWQRCLEIGERPDQDGCVAGRGSYLAAHNLHVICEGMGDEVAAGHYQALGQQMRPKALVSATV